jgi:hypothetical protein
MYGVRIPYIQKCMENETQTFKNVWGTKHMHSKYMGNESHSFKNVWRTIDLMS